MLSYIWGILSFSLFVSTLGLETKIWIYIIKFAKLGTKSSPEAQIPAPNSKTLALRPKSQPKGPNPNH